MDMYGPDSVGWYPASVSYIRENNPINSTSPLVINFPCGSQINQGLQITCPGSTVPYIDVASQPLTSSTYTTYMFNYRNQTCATLNYRIGLQVSNRFTSFDRRVQIRV